MDEIVFENEIAQRQARGRKGKGQGLSSHRKLQGGWEIFFKQNTEGVVREVGGEPGKDKFVKSRGGLDFKKTSMVNCVNVSQQIMMDENGVLILIFG